MSVKSVCDKIETYWSSIKIEVEKAPQGYYIYVTDNCKLYIYPEKAGATFMVIPTTKKYKLSKMSVQTQLGVMEINPDRKLSNPALLFGLSEDNLTKEIIDTVAGFMTLNVDQIFDQCQGL